MVLSIGATAAPATEPQRSTRERQRVAGRKTWAYVGSIVSILFGFLLVVLIFVTPERSVAALLWVIGAFAIVFGGMMIALAFTVRGQTKQVAAA